MTIAGVGLAAAPSATAGPAAGAVPASGNAGCIAIGSFALCIPFV